MQPPKPPTDDGSREPVTYFELQRRRDATPEPGEAAGDDIASLPPLPASSPWSGDQLPEPTIDRTEDGDTVGVAIDQLNRGD
jgi:hypothetical protein